MTPEQVRDLLRARARALGSQTALAKQLDVSIALINQIISGRAEPAKKICHALGIERVVTYRKVKPN